MSALLSQYTEVKIMKKIVVLLVVFLLLGFGAKSLFWHKNAPEADSDSEVLTPEIEIPIEEDKTAQEENSAENKINGEKKQENNGSSQNAGTTVTEQTPGAPVETVSDEPEEVTPSDTPDEAEETPSATEEVKITDDGDIELPEIP